MVDNGGFAHDVGFLIERINQVNPEWNFLGYIDKTQGGNVVGDDDFVVNYKGDLYAAIAITNFEIRRSIVAKYSVNRRINYPNLIDSSAIITDEVRLGRGNIICANSIFTVNITVGNFNIINHACTIGHDDVIGDYVTINPGSNISGNVSIGSCVNIGTGTQIIQGLSISDEAVIGAGSVVIKDIPYKSTAVGVPARVIKVRE